mmetsp:Transcript_22429/g.49146  ORF Transcript_22429/g.49146 Transcript_22429/m.49146 type:complete len:211 (+) Transcript_22429:52-684(+)
MQRSTGRGISAHLVHTARPSPASREASASSFSSSTTPKERQKAQGPSAVFGTSAPARGSSEGEGMGCLCPCCCCPCCCCRCPLSPCCRGLWPAASTSTWTWTLIWILLCEVRSMIHAPPFVASWTPSPSVFSLGFLSSSSRGSAFCYFDSYSCCGCGWDFYLSSRGSLARPGSGPGPGPDLVFDLGLDPSWQRRCPKLRRQPRYPFSAWN